jgi:hypothetical protein
MASNFETIASSGGVVATADKIEDFGARLFQVRGRITIPPVFHEKFAYIYSSQKGVGTLRAYYYNEGTYALELIC